LKRCAADTGAVILIQRFGSAANLNIHLHCLVLDAVYRHSEGELVFQEARAPTGDELRGLLDKIIARLMKMLTRASYLVEEQGMTYLAEIGPDHALKPLQAASCTYRIAFGPRAGQKVLSLRTAASRDEKSTPALCAEAHGFSLHAVARISARNSNGYAAIPDPLPRRAGPSRQTARCGRAGSSAQDKRARRRARARQIGAHELGTITETRVRHRLHSAHRETHLGRIFPGQVRSQWRAR
jgi:hypothetical protein